jgi:hypothetical protein
MRATGTAVKKAGIHEVAGLTKVSPCAMDWACHGQYGSGVSWPIRHRSPIAVGGESWLYDAQVAAYMLTLLEGSLAYIRTRSHQDQPHRITHAHNEADRQSFLERPFREALAAVYGRTHRQGVPH